MIDKNILLAQFWANANQLVTADGIEIDLHDDDLVVVSTTLKNTTGAPHEIQLKARFSLDDFIAEMEVQLVEDLSEINLDMLMVLLVGGKATYQILEE